MVELKKLVVCNADISRMPWYRKGAPPPGPADSSDVEFQWLERDAWERDPAVLDTPADLVSTRFSEAGRCLIGKNGRGATIYHLWLMPAGTFVGWIGTVLRPPARGMLVSDAWVDPAYRGRNVHRWGSALIVGEVARLGGQIITAGVEEHEFYTQAALYARLGLAISVPDYCLYWLRTGKRGIHWRWRPAKALQRFSTELEESYLA